jgi:soluble lytic murein transglycosylase-like protein
MRICITDLSGKAARIVGIGLLLCSWAAAAEIAVLHTGFQMRADRVECGGQVCVLHTGTGRIELPASSVARIESEPDEPKPSAAVVEPVQKIEQVRAPKTARELVEEMARLNGLPPEIVHSIAQVESAYQTKAVSPKGAIGVMQLMPWTARQMGADPHDLEQNIAAGAQLLRELLLKYENDPNPVRRALAAYNAGPGAVSRYGGVPPYRETQQYVEKVLERYWKLVKAKPTTD